MTGTRQRHQARDSPVEEAWGRELTRVLTVAPPWVLWVLVLAVAVILHLVWPSWPYTAGVCGVGVANAALAVRIARHRKGRVARLFPAGTVLALFGWLAAAQTSGLSRPIMGVWFIGGGLWLSGSWALWAHARAGTEQGGLHGLLDKASAPAGMEGMKVLSLRLQGRRFVGRFRLRPGVTSDQAIKSTGALESAGHMPPGSVQMSPNLDRADEVNVTISDPRILRAPQPWPGPSRPGASIAEPIVPSVWQDGEDCLYTITGHHLQVMGASGSGKSLGWAWSEIAETITRRDAAVLGFDITKGEQTLGPVRDALHFFDDTPDKVRARLKGVHKAVRARTDYLASQGLQRWKEDCGLAHVTLYLEEAPDIINLLDDQGLEDWVSDMRSARSAGMRWVLSLQRSDWTQMPTLVRGQLGRACFGVLDTDDARFGLSAVQSDRGATPELWGVSQPGMHYLDAACIPDTRKAMPLRTWYWGEDDSVIRDHAETWPAQGRPLDPVTAPIFAAAIPAPTQTATATQAKATLHTVPPDELDQDGDTTQGEDTMHELSPEDAAPVEDIVNDENTPLGSWQFEGTPDPAKRLDPDQARRVFVDQLTDWKAHGKTQFGIPELSEVRARTGRGRAWLYTVLEELERDRVISKAGGFPTVWQIEEPAAA